MRVCVDAWIYIWLICINIHDCCRVVDIHLKGRFLSSGRVPLEVDYSSLGLFGWLFDFFSRVEYIVPENRTCYAHADTYTHKKREKS